MSGSNKHYPFTLAAGASLQIAAKGLSAYVETLTADASIDVTDDTSDSVHKLKLAQGYRMPPGVHFDRLYVENPGSSEIAGVLVVGFGEFIDNRASVGDETLPVLETRPGAAMWGYQTCSAQAAAYSHVQLKNPAASGVTIALDRIFGMARADGAMVQVCRHDDALANDDGAGWAKSLGAAGPAGEIRFLKSGTATGSLRAYMAGHTPWQEFDWTPEQPFILGVGEGLLVRCDTVNVDLYCGFEWREY